MRCVTLGRLFGALAVVMAVAAHAETLTIDFEDLSQTGTSANYVASGYESLGYSFTSNIDPIFADQAFGSWNTGDVSFNGSTALFNNFDPSATQGSITTLRRVDGTLFALEAIDLGPWRADTLIDTPVLFEGIKANGTIVTARFTVPPALTPATYTFQSTFSNLASVRWENQPPLHQFDNLVVTGVPEPANGLLMLVGIVTLLWAIRRSA